MKQLAAILVFLLVCSVDSEAQLAKQSLKCRNLSQSLRKLRKLPEIKAESIKMYVTWRATLCMIPPTGQGDVTILCDGETPNVEIIFFWEKKYKGKVISNYIFCNPV